MLLVKICGGRSLFYDLQMIPHLNRATTPTMMQRTTRRRKTDMGIRIVFSPSERILEKIL